MPKIAGVVGGFKPRGRLRSPSKVLMHCGMA